VNVRGYNQRFAELWDIPQELMTRRDDAATHLWMTRNVLNSADYASRIRAIANSVLTESRDVVTLRNGRILERVSMPQLARGRPTGRVYSFVTLPSNSPMNHDCSSPLKSLNPASMQFA
jgi:hypothetical protein